ncbi:MAG: NAD(P)-dependent oxidoreductase [Saprospiraceae bacterium]
MKTCVITGAAGLVGSELLSLIPTDWKIYALYNSKKPPVLTHNISFVKCDFKNGQYLERLPEKCDCIIHLAQSNLFRKFPETAEDIFEVNTLSTQQLLSYGLKAGVSNFIYCSTGGLYKSTNELLLESDTIDLVTLEKNYYYASKFCSEILLKNYSEYFNTIIFRPFFIYGPNQNSDMLIPRITKNVMSKQTIRLEGKNGMQFNPIFCKDAAIAIFKATEYDNRQIFNLAGPSYVSLKEVINLISKYLGIPVEIEIIDKVALDFRASIELLSNNLYIPKVDIEEGIAKYLESLKLN